MNLLAIVLYNAQGEQRTVRFRPGRLNIVTGVSARGKSALLDIVEFCLGRSTVTMPVGPITRTVAWYAVVLQLPGAQAFIARPAPRSGASSSQRAMIKIAAQVQPPPMTELIINTDADSVRAQLGSLIGIDENLHVPEGGSTRQPLAAHLGHATWLCLQGQGEIGNRGLLFHRQGEQGVTQAIKDTLPYFLGAVPRDQAIKRQQLTVARRELRRREEELRAAERLNQELDVDMATLLNEAYAIGLIDSPRIDGRDASLAALRAIRARRPVGVVDDGSLNDRRGALQRRRTELRDNLRELDEQQAVLNQQGDGERRYLQAAQSGASRLASINLIPDGDGDGGTCPVCSSPLAESDPTVAQMRRSLDQLRSDLTNVEAARPRRAAALAELDQQATAIRQELRAVDAALVGIRAADAQAETDQRRAQAQAFTQGRIDLYLTRLRHAEDDQLARLRERAALAARAVSNLEGQLDPDNEREQLTSRLLVIAQDMTRWADQLQLEHAGTNVRFDLTQLTVVTDTDDGPAPLARIGSAANWVGYHLVAHLALHRYFVRNDRPVPHLLMLDQPTQAYYPSDLAKQLGIPERDDDRAAVRRLYRLMHSVVQELAPQLQIIVCDHANLEDDWFQDSVEHNWRGDDPADPDNRLIPQAWIDQANRPR